MTNSTDDSAPTASAPPERPIRLDGAFPRVDADDWRAAAEASLRDDATLDSLARKTLDGLTVEVLYDESGVQGRRTSDEASTEDLASDPNWDNRTRVLGETPETLAAHALAALAGGATSLELAVGAACGDGDTPPLPLDALPRVLDGVHLDMIALSLRAGDDTEAALDALLALHDERGIDPADARVELDADPLGELARRGRLRDDLPEARTRLVAVARRVADELPGARAVAVDTVVHHAAGASPCQELVAGIAAATDYLDALLDAGLAPEAACRTIVFHVALDADLVAGVVKLRALERLWCHALTSASLPVVRPHVVVETSRRHLSRRAPWVNHLRNVAAGTAAAIGGADTLLVHPHDRVDGQRVGDDAAVADRVARNLAILLAEEGGLLAVDDAAGGSHAIESLTRASVESAWSALGELQRAGGLAASLASGAWREDIARTHAARLARLASGERVQVGVTRYRHDGSEPPAPDDVETGTPKDARTTGRAPDGRHAGDGARDDGDRSGGERDDGGNREHGDGDAERVVPLRPVREAHAFEGEPDAAAGTERTDSVEGDIDPAPGSDEARTGAST